MPSTTLETVMGDQKRWSSAANVLKASIDGARRLVLWLGILGAVLETLAAQIAHVTKADDIKLGTTAESGLAMALGYLGAAALAVSAIVRQQKLGRDRSQAWTLCRAGSESLKREMYRYRTAAGPYATAANKEAELLDRRDQILDKLTAYQRYTTNPQQIATPAGALDADGYLQERLTGEKGNISFYNERSETYTGRVQLLNNMQMFLAILGALLGVGVTLSHNQTYGAWVAVVTTISGALSAHVLAQRYEQLTISYRATAQRLQGAIARWQANSSNDLGDLVEVCENILLQENQGWIAGADQQ